MPGLDKLTNKLKENHVRAPCPTCGRSTADLIISRVPKDTKTKFLDMANKEFCGDYGMLLKWLMDGLIDKDNQIIFTALDEHEKRIQALESEPQVEEQKGREIKMMNGKIIRTGGKKK